MSWPVFTQTFKSYFLTIVLYAAGLFLYSLLLTSMYKFISSLGETYTNFLRDLPEEFSSVFVREETLAGGPMTIEAFLSLEHLSLFWIIIVGAFVIGFAARSLAGEVEQGTVALLLAQPITRTQMFFSKFLVGVLGILVLVAATIGGIVLQANLSDFAMAPSTGYWLFSAIASLFFVALLSVCMFFSSLVNERGRAILFGMLFLVISYVADLFSRLQEGWENLRYASLMYYYGKPDDILSTATFPDAHLAVLAGVVVVFVLFALIRWNRRDIAV